MPSGLGNFWVHGQVSNGAGAGTSDVLVIIGERAEKGDVEVENGWQELLKVAIVVVEVFYGFERGEAGIDILEMSMLVEVL